MSDLPQLTSGGQQ